MANTLKVRISGDTGSLERAFARAGNVTTSFSSKTVGSLKAVAKASAFLIGGAALGGIATVLKVGYGEWQDSAKIAAQTGAVLKSTGGAANITAGQVGNLAGALLAKSGIDDEAIQSGENMLLTFTNVRNETGRGNDVFNQATSVLTDMTTAMTGGNVTSEAMSKQAIQLGKALNDPIAGIGALHKVGVTFTDGQKDQIKTMVEAGDTMGAQKVILAELNKEFGGSAEALGKTLPGEINKAKEQFNNLSGAIVGGLAPAFAGGLGAVNSFLGKFSEADGASAKFRVVGETIKSTATGIADIVKRAFNAIDWGDVGHALADGAKAAVNFLVTTFRSINWGEVGRTVGTALVKALNTLDGYIQRVNWAGVGGQISHGFAVAVKAVAVFLAGVDWRAVLGALFTHIFTVLRAEASLLLGIAKPLGLAIVNGIKAGALAGWHVVASWFASLPGTIEGYFAGAGSWLINAGEQVMLGFVHGIESKINAVKDTLTGMAGKIKSWKGPPAKDAVMLYPAGQLVIGGFIGGIVSRFGDVRSVLGQHSALVLGEINKLQASLDAINARREREDLASAVRDAATALAEARKKGEGVAAAEQTLQRAREDVKVAATQRELTADQAHYAKVQAALETANSKIKAAQEKALAAYQTNLDRAQTRAAASFETVASLIKEGFGAVSDAFVSPAQQKINAIMDRRSQEDLTSAVQDAQDGLAQAMEGGDPAAIADAQRTLARATEDIQLASLQRQAAQQDTAHDQMANAQSRNLDKMLTTLQGKFGDQGVAAGKGMQAILDIVNGYLGGFKGAGQALGDAFAGALRDAITKAVKDANVIVGTKSSSPGASSRTGVGHLPALANGGIVMRPTLALVGEAGPEAVVPLSRARGFGGAGALTVIVQAGTVIGGDMTKVARDLAGPLEVELRRRVNNGGLGIVGA